MKEIIKLAFRENNRKITGETLENFEWGDLTLSDALIEQCTVRKLNLSRLNAAELNINSVGMELSDLRECSFSKTLINELTLLSSNIVKGNFNKCELVNVRWDNCSSPSVKFINSVLINNTFSVSDLYKARFTDSQILRSEFSSSLNNGFTTMQKVDFSGSIFVDTTFQNIDLTEAIFERTAFFNCRFEECELDADGRDYIKKHSL